MERPSSVNKSASAKTPAAVRGKKAGGRSRLTITAHYAPDQERQLQALLIVLGYSVADAVSMAREANAHTGDQTIETDEAAC